MIKKSFKSYISLLLSILFCFLSFGGCANTDDASSFISSNEESNGVFSEIAESEEKEISELQSSDSSIDDECGSSSIDSEKSSSCIENESDAIINDESSLSAESKSDIVSDDENIVSEDINSSSELELSEEVSGEVSEEISEEISEEESKEVSVSKDPHEPLVEIPKSFEADEIDAFFDDSVFIGYSIMMHFGKYIKQWKIDVDQSIMGDSIFCCGVGMNFTKNRIQTPETKNNTLPKYQGNSYNFEDLPKATGSNAIYIGLMGFSELKNSTLENCVNYAINESIAGIESIKRKNPDVNVVILSSTYNTGTYATGELNPQRANNENIRLYNVGVLEYCNENGIDFIDVSTPMLDGRGYMPIKYASDRDYHIKKEPFKIWVNIFRDYARKKSDGTWKNISAMPPLVAE